MKDSLKYYLPLLVLIIIGFLRVGLLCISKGSYEKCTAAPQVEEIPIVKNIQNSSIDIVYRMFPSPHAELLLGMVMGVDRLGEVPSFKKSLKISGTTHVVVVSGFNISLVFGLVVKALGSKFKLRNVVIATFVTLFYSILTGFQPPVVRAWVMGNVLAWGKYYGRSIDGLRVLIFAAIAMIIVSPSIIFSLSFQLSFAACLGLLTFSERFKNIKNYKIPEDLSTTLSAQVFVWPLISHYMGTVSLVSLVTNPLILWTVPISTVLGGLYLLIGAMNFGMARFIAILVFPFLNMFVKVVYWASETPFASVQIRISLAVLLLYYIFVGFVLYGYKKC